MYRRVPVQRNLVIRIASAAIVTPLVLAVLFFGPAWAWFGTVLVCVGLVAVELFELTHPQDPIARLLAVASTLGVAVVLYTGTHDPRVLLTVAFLVPIFAMASTVWRTGEPATAPFRMAMASLGPLWLGGLFTTIALIRRDAGLMPALGGLDDPGRWVVLMTLSFAWFGDTSAYFVGRALGGPKLHAVISPGKTWAGLAGSVLGACLAGLWAHFFFLPQMPLLDALGLAVVSGTLGQLGDLAESLIKRSSGKKDSGWILPGHGGLLDRVDALMVVSTVVYVYLLWKTPL